MHSWLLSVHKVKYKAGLHHPVKQANLLFALINTLHLLMLYYMALGRVHL